MSSRSIDCRWKPAESGKGVICTRCWQPCPVEAPRNCSGPRGLGDIVASWLLWLGIRKRPGCGCDERKTWLNGWRWPWT